MLASITPLGERGRHQRWGVTVTAHTLGGALGGAVTGGAFALLGTLLPADAQLRLVALAALLALAAMLDLAPARLLPSSARQVDERWLNRYRGWVYGAGFGAQLGTGVATIVTSASVYAILAGCLLAPSAGWGLALGASFGLVRGATPTLTAPIVDTARLVRFHRRFAAIERPVSWATVAVLAALAAAAALAGAA